MAKVLNNTTVNHVRFGGEIKQNLFSYFLQNCALLEPAY